KTPRDRRPRRRCQSREIVAAGRGTTLPILPPARAAVFHAAVFCRAERPARGLEWRDFGDGPYVRTITTLDRPKCERLVHFGLASMVNSRHACAPRNDDDERLIGAEACCKKQQRLDRHGIRKEPARAPA